MSINSVKRWFAKYEKYLFSYKNGYFVLPYLGNSPYAIVESFKKMPFIRHDSIKQILYCNNVFAKGKIHYQEIEKNMMLMITTIEYKKNVTFKKINDDSQPSTHYTFSFVANIIKDANHNGIYNGKSFNNSVWMLIKPAHYVPTKYSKGTNCIHIDVFVDKEWIQENLYKENNPLSKKLDEFILSNENFIVWSELMHNSNELTQAFEQAITIDTNSEHKSYLKLKCECYMFIDKLLNRLNDLNIDINANDKNKIDEQNLLVAEQLLNNTILSDFIGIEALSREACMSATKLKILFKEKYGMTIYQYFQQKQMQYAFQALTTNSCQIKTLANQLGYKNVSKFSSTFRKHYHVLPSEVQKQNNALFQKAV